MDHQASLGAYFIDHKGTSTNHMTPLKEGSISESVTWASDREGLNFQKSYDDQPCFSIFFHDFFSRFFAFFLKKIYDFSKFMKRNWYLFYYLFLINYFWRENSCIYVSYDLASYESKLSNSVLDLFIYQVITREKHATRQIGRVWKFQCHMAVIWGVRV